jgi:hypothetical protein
MIFSVRNMSLALLAMNATIPASWLMPCRLPVDEASSGGVSDPLESQGSLTVSDDHSLTLRSDRNRESKEHPFPFHESHMI